MGTSVLWGYIRVGLLFKAKGSDNKSKLFAPRIPQVPDASNVGHVTARARPTLVSTGLAVDRTTSGDSAGLGRQSRSRRRNMIRITGSRKRQYRAFELGAGLGLAACLLLILPQFESLHARGAMNTGHESVRCASCHQPAARASRYRPTFDSFWVGAKQPPPSFIRQSVTNNALDAMKDPMTGIRFIAF